MEENKLGGFIRLILFIVCGVLMAFFAFKLDDISNFLIDFFEIKSQRRFYANLIGWLISLSITVVAYLFAYKFHLESKVIGPLVAVVSSILFAVFLLLSIGLLIPLFNTW